ncbi:MAG: hypothetical protein IJ644_01805 [Oscillospiraceae bacterium]|nr:hypothetical protein [Oscillospiraceae bacterium]
MLTVNTFLALLLKAKREGKGKISNGMFLIKLISTLSDDNESDIIKLFTIKIGTERDKELNRIADRLVKNSAKYPHPDEICGVKLTKFQRLCGQEKPNANEYKLYLERMNAFCRNYLNHQKYTALVYSLLEFLHQDENSRLIFYDNQFINKSEFFGNYAHPKKICLEALLVGLWYQVQMSRNTENAKSVELLALPAKLSFYVFLLTDSDEYAFRKEYSVLKSELNLDAPVDLKETLCRNAKHFHTESEKIYPPEIRCENIRISELPETRNLFLYGTGGTGKSTCLVHQISIQERTCFLLPLYRYREELHPEFFPDVSCWILLHILLKYLYQYEYQTYEACSLQEPLLSQMTELNHLLKNSGYQNQTKYLLMLDGMNEISSEKQDILTEELRWICQEWQNVQIIITGRSTPFYDVFEDFEKLELCGISEYTRNGLLSELPDYAQIQKNSRLMEVLKTPLFLKLYLESRQNDSTLMLNTCGEILEHYVTSVTKKISLDYDKKTVQFIIQYILPVVATQMLLVSDFTVKRSELLTAVEKAYDIYLTNPEVCHNFIEPQKYRKKSLLESRENIIELILENICFLTAIPEALNCVSFTHQYFRDYFAARHIMNILQAAETAYDAEEQDKKLEFIFNSELAYEWYDTPDFCRLIGEISGDYKNLPASDTEFHYHRTLIDSYLDLQRHAPEKFIAHHVLAVRNIIEVMRDSRNRIICGADFINITLPPDLLNDTQFSLDGKYPSRFEESDTSFLCVSHYVGDVLCAAYAPNGDSILICLSGGHVILWDLITKSIQQEYHLKFLDEPEQVIFSPDGKCAAFLSFGSVMIVEIPSREVTYHHIQNAASRVYFYHQHNEWILHKENKIRMLHSRTEISAEFNPIFAFYSHDRKRLLTGDKHNIMLFDTAQKQCIYQKKIKDSLINGMILTDNTCVFCSSSGVFLWNPEQNQISVIYENIRKYDFQDVIFSPDGQYCVILCDMAVKQFLLLIHISTGKNQILADYVKQVLFSDDSSYLLFTIESENKTSAVLYHLTTEKYQIIEEYPNNPFLMHSLIAAFSPDYQHFLLCSDDEEIWKFTQYTTDGNKEELPILENFQNLKGCHFTSDSLGIYGNDETALKNMGAAIDEI